MFVFEFLLECAAFLLNFLCYLTAVASRVAAYRRRTHGFERESVDVGVKGASIMGIAYTTKSVHIRERGYLGLSETACDLQLVGPQRERTAEVYGIGPPNFTECWGKS